MVKYTDKQKAAYYKKLASRRRAPAPMYRRIKGRGDYSVDQKPRSRGLKKDFFNAPNLFSDIGGVAGGVLGNVIAPGAGGAIGGIAGRAFGKGLGHLFRGITGYGDYTVKQNSLVYPNQQVPQFGPGRTCVRIQHKEYIARINSSTSFSLQQFDINPAMPETFPWLSQIAQQFEQYRFNGLVFAFASTSADALNSTNTALGKVVMATDYSAVDPDYVNIQQMMGSEFSTMGKPSESLLHAIECDPAETPVKLFYTRAGDPPANADKRLYDLGNFQIATDGSQAAAEIGDLWVSYDVTLCKPQLNNVLGLDLMSAHYNLTGATQSGAKYFGTSRAVADGSNLDVSITDDTISFPTNMSAGRYLIEYDVVGNSTACTQPTLTLVNCSQVSYWANGAINRRSNTGQTVTSYIDCFIVDITDQNASVTFTGGTLPASASSGDLTITQIPHDME